MAPYNNGSLHPEPPELPFFPQSLNGVSRSPRSGELDPRDIPYGALGALLRFGYYTPNGSSSANKHTRSFVRTRNDEPETFIDVVSNYYSVPLTSQRLILYNYPPDLGGTRPSSAPNLNYLDTTNRLNGLINTQFLSTNEGGEIIDAVNASGAMKSMTFYRHRTQVCEEIFQYLFKGDYVSSLQSHPSTLSINVSDIAQALEAHDGLYTEEQENTPKDEPPPPPIDNRFKMDIGQFDRNDVVYLNQPSGNPVEVTLLDSGTNHGRLGRPLMIVFDGRSGSGRFTIRFLEFINRPILYVLLSTTIEFTGSTAGTSGISAGAIAGAFLMDEDSGFASDHTSSQSSQVIYGAVLGHYSLLERGFQGAGGHSVPVLEFPNMAFYDNLEARKHGRRRAVPLYHASIQTRSPSI